MNYLVPPQKNKQKCNCRNKLNFQIIKEITPDDKVKRKHFSITVLDQLPTYQNFLKPLRFLPRFCNIK